MSTTLLWQASVGKEREKNNIWEAQFGIFKTVYQITCN